MNKILALTILLAIYEIAISINLTDLPKNPHPRVYREESLDKLKQKISTHNCIVVFHADWCGHW
jgi:hypothetical protein